MVIKEYYSNLVLLWGTGYWIQKQQAFDASPEEIEVYNKLYNAYTQAYGGVRNVCHELAALRSSMLL
jgi:hypothetical protein